MTAPPLPAAAPAAAAKPPRHYPTPAAKCADLVVHVVGLTLALIGGIVLLLRLAGGLLYSPGVIFSVNKRLKFAPAIWHGHVVAAAATHWAAVLLGVVRATR